jgi:predicted Zn-dependent protease
MRKKAVAITVVSIAAEAALAGVSGPVAGVSGPVAGAAIYAGARVSSLILVESIYGYSREVENQADRDGIAAVTAAGYDPHAMAATFALFENDSTLEYTSNPTIYQDHPKLEARRAEALAFASTNTPAAARTGSEKDYLSAVAPAIVSNINMDLECRRPRTAVARAARFVDAFPDDAQYQVLLGESYHALGAKTTQPTPDELTPEGEATQRKLVLNKTEEQEQEKLLRTPEGQAALRQNQTAAENLFLAAIQSHPDYAPAYRELGFLYQDEARYSDAAANYQHYLQLVASTSLDRYRIERRLSQVQSLQTPQAR